MIRTNIHLRKGAEAGGAGGDGPSGQVERSGLTEVEMQDALVPRILEEGVPELRSGEWRLVRWETAGRI